MIQESEVPDDSTLYFLEAARPYILDRLEMLLLVMMVLPFFFWIHLSLISGMNSWEATIVSLALGFGEVLAGGFLVGALIFRRRFEVTSTYIALTYPRIFFRRKPRIRRIIMHDEIATAQFMKEYDRRRGESMAWSMHLKLRDGFLMTLSSGESTRNTDCISAIERFIMGIPGS